MDVVSRPRVPSFERKGCPAPAEVLFKRGVELAGVAASGAVASSQLCSARCGGVAVEDQRIPVQRVLRELRSPVSRQDCAAFQSVASASRSVASRSVFVASAFERSEFQSAYQCRVASASQSAASRPARDERPSGTIPLVLKSLVRRAAATKVSRLWRRLEDASQRGVPAFDQASRERAFVKSGGVASVSVASKSRFVSLRSPVSRAVASMSVASLPAVSLSGSLRRSCVDVPALQ